MPCPEPCRQLSVAGSLTTADLPSLINHGLSALADTLQQDKHLTVANTALAVIGPADESIEKLSGPGSGAVRRGGFRVYENENVDQILRAWRRSRGEPEEGPQEEGEGEGEAAAASTDAAVTGAAGSGTVETGDDVEMS